MKTIGEITKEWESSSMEEWAQLFREYQSDERAGVRRLLLKYERKLDAVQKERERIRGMMRFEDQYPDCEWICGIDEAGRGPLAGPVVAGAVILPKGLEILYVNDSKQLSESRREELYGQIMDQAISVGVGVVGPDQIDRVNILQATYEAMRRALEQLDPKPQILFNDAVTIPGVEFQQVPIIKGDAKSISIAAASIIAKVTRDRMMREYDALFPAYGFAQHKGYGSKAHMEAIRTYGPCPIHRRSFLKAFL